MIARRFQTCLGLFYVGAGIGKFFPQVESVEEALAWLHRRMPGACSALS